MVSTDICFVNTLPFLGTLSQIKFGTIQHMADRKKKTMLSGLTTVCRLYGARGFTVKVINTDNEFECLRADLMALGITLNVTAANENVPEMERRFRVIKERARGIRNDLPYITMPKIMVIELLYFVVHWLNTFPVKSGVSETLSPAVIITGRSPDYKKHCKAKFGSYVQTHEEDQPRNSLKARTIGAITLRPDNSQQARY